MNDPIPTISAATRSAIRDHIIESERRVPHPYLDIKGNVTIGVGFKTDTEDDFAKLDLQVFKDGKWVEANGEEKRQAFQKIQAEKERRGGDLNARADDYKKITDIRMLLPAQDALLDKKISKNVENIKKGVGEDAWNKLNDGQKAAVTDIVHANGKIEKFPELVKAIKAEDAKKMADESTFYTDSKTGRRDEDRLKRNYQALSGLSQEESDKRLQDLLKKNDAARKTNPSNTPAPQSGSEDNPSGGGDGPSDGPQSGNNGPTGQDDGADDKNPSGGSSSGGSSGEGQPQSLNLTDPEAPSQTMELKLGEEGKGQTMELKPEQRKLMDDISKSDGALDEIVAKDPRDWTEGEFMEIKKEVVNLPAGPEQERLDAMATNFLEHKFGDGLAKYDAVGRMIDPEPIRPINQKPVPAKTPDGEPLTGAVNKIGRVVAGAAGGEGRASAVQGLQSGLNLLKQVMERSAKSSRAGTPGFDLKTDGVVGPKTRRALRSAAANFGRPKIEEGFALGRFGNFARDVQTGRDDTRKLGPTIGKAFGPLFRDPQGPRQRPSRPAEENLSFQATVNDLGFNVFGRDTFKPIKEDGLIGPRTETAFNAVLPAAGPDRFTSRLGHNLGFFDFDDFG